MKMSTTVDFNEFELTGIVCYTRKDELDYINKPEYSISRTILCHKDDVEKAETWLKDKKPPDEVLASIDSYNISYQFESHVCIKKDDWIIFSIGKNGTGSTVLALVQKVSPLILTVDIRRDPDHVFGYGSANIIQIKRKSIKLITNEELRRIHENRYRGNPW